MIESLRGLSRLLLVQYKTPVSPRVVMALKPFIEKEDPNIKLAALTVLNAIVYNWQRTAPSADDDLIDHFLWCLPCLIIRLEDTDKMVVEVMYMYFALIANNVKGIIKLYDRMLIVNYPFVIRNRLRGKLYVKLQIFCRANAYRI